MDDQPRHLQIEAAPDRVADRRIDLPGDLGDRDAQGDIEVEFKIETVLEAHAQAWVSEVEAVEESADGTAREARDAIGSKGRIPNDIDDRPASDERTAGRLVGWHAGDVLLARRVGRRPGGAPEAVWYPTASVRARTSSNPAESQT